MHLNHFFRFYFPFYLVLSYPFLPIALFYIENFSRDKNGDNMSGAEWQIYQLRKDYRRNNQGCLLDLLSIISSLIKYAFSLIISPVVVIVVLYRGRAKR